VQAGQYWRLEKPRSFDEFLERRFPESRRKAYYLISIHEHLPPQARRELKQVGWSKGLELAKVARRDGQHFDCATWLHKAREMPYEPFRREVEKELKGREAEPHEIIYFKIYKSQIPVIEQAIETAARMLGSDKSRGYCLEMIRADFLAGAYLDNGNLEILLNSLSRSCSARRAALLFEVLSFTCHSACVGARQLVRWLAERSIARKALAFALWPQTSLILIFLLPPALA
jgi:hypothetical protein